MTQAFIQDQLSAGTKATGLVLDQVRSAATLALKTSEKAVGSAFDQAEALAQAKSPEAAQQVLADGFKSFQAQSAELFQIGQGLFAQQVRAGAAFGDLIRERFEAAAGTFGELAKAPVAAARKSR